MRWWIALIALVALVVGLAILPLRLALAWSGADAAGLSARGVTGSIWAGRVHDAVWHGASLGTVDVGLDPSGLLLGELRMKFARDDALLGNLSGVAILSGTRGLEDVTGSLSLGASIAGVPLDTVRLNGVSVRFDEAGRCVAGSGSAQLILALPVPGLDLSNGLSGPIACHQGLARASLMSQSGMESLWADVKGDGSWQARLAVKPGSDPMLDGLLRTAGFLAEQDALVLRRSGRL